MHMIFDLVHKMQQERIPIFSNWRIEQPNLQYFNPQPEQNIQAQQKQAYELIKSGYLVCANIQEYIKSQQKNHKQWVQLKGQVTGSLDQLHTACNSRHEIDKFEDMMSKLKNNVMALYCRLRQTRMLQNRLKVYFQSANLANYDPNTTQPKFTKSDEQMKEQLKDTIQLINKRIKDVHRTLRIRLSRRNSSNRNLPLTGEQSFELQMDRLKEALSHDRLVHLHYLMLRQLQINQSFLQQVASFNRGVEQEYLKYETILDSFYLMQDETAQMKEIQQNMHQFVEKVRKQQGFSHPEEFQGQLKLQQAKTDRNLPIYQANLRNFVRVNAQINMHLFYQKKWEFMQQLQQFKQTTSDYREQTGTIGFLNKQNYEFKDIKQRQKISKKISPADRNNCQNIYRECSRVSCSGSQSQEYQTRTLSRMSAFMKKLNIEHSPYINSGLPLQSSLRSQVNFFRDLYSRPKSEQYRHIHQRQQEINDSIFQLQTIAEAYKQDQERSVISAYLNCFKQCQKIAKSSQNTYQQQLKYFSENLSKQTNNHQICQGFYPLLYHYVSDIDRMVESRKYFRSMWETLQPKMNTNIVEGLKKNSGKINIDSLIMQSLSAIEDLWLHLFQNYYRRLSQYGRDLILPQLDRITQPVLQLIQNNLHTQANWLIKKHQMQVDRKHFYTHRVLAELNRATSKSVAVQYFKISNFSQILGDVCRQLDYQFFDMSTAAKIGEVLKLASLQKYMLKVNGKQLSRGQNNVVKSSLVALGQIKKHIYWLTISELTLAQLQPEVHGEQQKIMHSLVFIQQLMTRSKPSLAKSDKVSAIQDILSKFGKDMQKLPLTVSGKQALSCFPLLLTIKQSAQQIQTCQKQELQGVRTSRIYVCCSQLQQANRVTGHNYQSFENIVVKQNRTHTLFLQKQREKVQPVLLRVDKQLSNVLTNFTNSKHRQYLPSAISALSKKLKQ